MRTDFVLVDAGLGDSVDMVLGIVEFTSVDDVVLGDESGGLRFIGSGLVPSWCNWVY